MNPRIAISVLLVLLTAAAASHAAAPNAPAGTPQWTVGTQAIGPAQLTGHGSFTPASQVVNQGDTATVTPVADPGYRLAGVDTGGCGGVDNGDGSWTTDQIYGDCSLVATFVLDTADVVFQGDFDADIRTFDDVNLQIPATVLGASINWQTGATCTGTSAAPCDNTYHFRPASSLPLAGRFYLVFRYPTSIAADTYGVTTDLPGEDGYSVPLQSGAVIGPAQPFGFPLSAASTSAWRSQAGVDGYVGFRFLDANTGRVDYGYARLVTSSSSSTTPPGLPATLVGFAYNRRGEAITIP